MHKVIAPIDNIEAMTLYDAAVFHGVRKPRLTALSYMGRRISYGALANLIDRYAAYLQAAGVRAGTHAALALPNGVAFACLLYALNRLGAVAVLMNPKETPYELHEKLVKTDCEFFFYIEAFAHTVPKVVRLYDSKGALPKCCCVPLSAHLPVVLSAVMRAKGAKARRSHGKEMAALGQALLPFKPLSVKAVIDPPHTDAAAPAVILFSGGTTGTPKAVVHTSQSINAAAWACVQTKQPIYEGEAFLALLPPFHIFGLTVSLHIALMAGTKCVLLPSFRSKGGAKAIVKHKPSFFAAVPLMVEKMLNTGLLQKAVDKGMNTSFFRQAFIGGDALSPELRDRFNGLIRQGGGSGLLEMGYGLSEICPVSFNHTEEHPEQSVGTVFGDTEVLIVSEEDNPVPVGQAGEICLCSPAAFLEYYKDEEETRQVLRYREDGRRWLYTGDMGYLTQDGQLCFLYRRKKILKVNNCTVLATAVEDCLCKLPYVRAACAVTDGQALKAYVAVSDGEKEALAGKKTEILDHCRQYVSKTHVPHEIVLCTLSELPVTLLGKISFGKL